MPNPTRRFSRSRRDKRRTHQKLTAPNVISCPQCTEPTLPHRVCRHCGYYKSREVVTIEES
ncbi:MAG: 50S ribosomal protein L32 [Deltaproteobacteria bacterium]|nr:50S ribosomal protein L32 [Deltaproteobacteria bacterium]